jgi:hypothetical protein
MDEYVLPRVNNAITQVLTRLATKNATIELVVAAPEFT